MSGKEILITLVRHGEATARWSEERDPGLSALGTAQARETAERLAKEDPVRIVSSPLRRARETAEPLEEIWGAPALVEARVSEVPSPPLAEADRAGWLATFMASSWDRQDDLLLQWRREFLGFLASLEADAVIFSHFVAINVAVGAATGDGRVTCFRPDNCSITRLDTRGGRLGLLERGLEKHSRVL